MAFINALTVTWIINVSYHAPEALGIPWNDIFIFHKAHLSFFPDTVLFLKVSHPLILPA